MCGDTAIYVVFLVSRIILVASRLVNFARVWMIACGKGMVCAGVKMA